jgi:RND family efflux transporter MFP subunit
VIPQVKGKVTYVAPSLVAGGFFKKGELLFRLEDADYRLALERAKAQRAGAELELERIKSLASIARAEWERISEDDSEPNPLVVYEPQLKSAHAALASADAAIGQAELDLSRTKIRAPFNCLVRSENLDIDQYIKEGTSVAVITGTDTAEIIVPLSMDELGWIAVPRSGSKEEGSPATASLLIAGEKHEWQGRVTRSLGEVDQKSRMIKVAVEVNDPYMLKGEDNGVALPVGSFVDVDLYGKTLKGVFRIPRAALRDKSTVWVADGEDKLRISSVTVVRRERADVLIGEGLKEGDQVILTTLAGASDGMKLRPSEKKAAQ